MVEVLTKFKLFKRAEVICWTELESEQINGFKLLFDTVVVPNSLMETGVDETKYVVNWLDKKIFHSSHVPIIFWFLTVNDG